MANTPVKRLSIIGAGRVGKTLGRLFHVHSCFAIEDIVNADLANANNAAAFIGAGSALGEIERMKHVEAILVSTPDDQIQSCARALAKSVDIADTTVFHVSGSQPSTLLEDVRIQGASVASVHPLISVPDPQSAINRFAGTCCSIEGGRRAVNMLRPAFESIGATLIQIDPEHKISYHAGAVFVSNFIVSLVDIGQRLVSQSGIDSNQAQAALLSLAEGSLRQAFESDPPSALTGPIARGDANVVRQHLQSITDDGIRSVYRQLALATLDVARRKDAASRESLDEIAELLQSDIRSN